jgi:hypothetical protein
MKNWFREFFFTPAEVHKWIVDAIHDLKLWAVDWRVGSDATIIGPADIQPDWFVSDREQPLQLFLGRDSLSSPHWRQNHGKQLLDFAHSYAVQVVPPILIESRSTLLQGRIAILRANEYADSGKATALRELFGELTKHLEGFSAVDYVISQELSTGKKKVWRDIALGAAIPQMSGVHLRQFLDGEVEFRPEPAAEHGL